MEKRKIIAREIIRDVRSGLSDQELMEKYTLSSQGLQSVFHKLTSAGVIIQAELDDRVPITERTVDIGLYICPACGNIQGKEFITCPRCGFSAPGRGKTAQGDRPANSEKKTPAGPQPRQKADGETNMKRDVGPVSTREQGAESEETRDSFPDLTRALAYCRVLGVAALAAYVLTVAGIIMQGTAPASELSLVALSIIGISAIAIASIVFVTLRALAEAIKIFASVAGSLSRNQPSRQ